MDYRSLLSKDDLNAFWALFADNLANLLIVTGVCRFVFNMPPEVVFGRILPGAGIAILFGVLVYVRMALRLAAREQRTTVTALPYGISTPVMFVYLFGVIGPIYWSTGDSLLAWQVGTAAGVLGGLIEVAGAVTGPLLQRITPRAGMLGTLAGIALVFIGTVPFSEIYEHPLIGMVSLSLVLWGLVGRFRLPLGLPAGMSALIAGTLVALALGEAKLSVEGAGFYPPLPYFSDVVVGFSHLWSHPELLAVLIPVQIYNFIETMNNVESAASVGDHYHVGHCQLTDGAGTMLGGLFGSPFPTTVYIGHPAYKRMRARSGYALGVGLVFFLGSMFGLLAFLGHLIPAVVVSPILVFVSVSMVSTAFRACKPEHAVAVALALLPHVSGILTVKWGSLMNALRELKLSPPDLMAPELTAAMLAQGAHVAGHVALSSGAIVTGMLWGGFAAYLIDRRFLESAATALVAALLAGFGVIHDARLHWLDLGSSFMHAYLCLALIIAALSRAPIEQIAEEDIV